MTDGPEPLTVDQAIAALAIGNGPAPAVPPKPEGDGYRAHCPACGPAAGQIENTWTLLITQNGRGAAYDCTTGCHPAAIDALARAAQRAAPSGDKPLDNLRDRLAELDDDRGRLAGAKSVVMFGEDGDSIEIEFETGRPVDLGTLEQLGRQDHWRRKMLPRGRVVPRLKPVEYDALLQTIIDAAEHREGAGTAADEALDLLAAYLRGMGVAKDADGTTPDGKRAVIGHLERRQPCIDATGRVYLRPTDFARHIKRDEGINIELRDLRTRLARLGFTDVQLTARGENSVKRQIRAWVSRPGLHTPDGLSPPSPYARRAASISRGDNGDNGDTRIEGGNSRATDGDTTGDTGDTGAGSAS